MSDDYLYIYTGQFLLVGSGFRPLVYHPEMPSRELQLLGLYMRLTLNWHRCFCLTDPLIGDLPMFLGGGLALGIELGSSGDDHALILDRDYLTSKGCQEKFRFRPYKRLLVEELKNDCWKEDPLQSAYLAGRYPEILGPVINLDRDAYI